MFTKKMLKRLLNAMPRSCQCCIVVGNIAYEIKGVAMSQPLAGHTKPARVWFVAGEVADHVPPHDVHAPSQWLNRQHNTPEAP